MASPPARRSPRSWWVATVVVVLLLGGGLWWWRRTPASSPARHHAHDRSASPHSERHATHRRWARSPDAAPDAPVAEEAEPDPEGLIYGTVTDSVTNLPIAGAEIRYSAWIQKAGPGALRVTSSDASGAYAIPAFPDCLITAGKPGYARDRATCAKPDLRLGRAIHMRGTVRDKATGAPIDGARAICGWQDDDDPLDPAVAAETDASGAYDLDECATKHLTVHHPDYATADLQIQAPPGATITQDVEMERGFLVEGVVRDANGDAVTDGLVGAFQKYGSYAKVSTMTRTDGTFEIGPLAEDQWFLTATELTSQAAGQARVQVPHTGERVQITLGGTRDLLIRVQIGNEPMVDARVYVRTTSPTDDELGDRLYHLRDELDDDMYRAGHTDAHGELWARNLAIGVPYRVIAATDRGEGAVTTNGTQTEVSVHVEEAGEVEAFVADERGTALTDVRTSLVSVCPEPPASCMRFGQYPVQHEPHDLFRVPPGDYWLAVREAARCPSSDPIQLTVEAGRRTQAHIVCHAGGHVTGRVIWAATGRPAHGLQVQAEADDKHRFIRHDGTYTRRDGTFDLADVGRGSRLTIRVMLPSADGSFRVDPDLLTPPSQREYSFAGYGDDAGAWLAILERDLPPVQAGEVLELGTLEIPARTPPPKRAPTDQGDDGFDEFFTE